MKKTMIKRGVKKLGLVLSLAACMGMLAGCGGNDSPNSGTDADNIEDTKVYKIGISQFADHPSLDNCREGLIEGLRQSGFEEGRNVQFFYDNAQADTGIANQIATNYVANQYDMICAVATPTAQAAYNAADGKNIPVIFTAVSDPVAVGLANADGSAGLATTGTSDLLPLEKQVAMIRAFLPEAKTIGVVYTTSETNSVSQIARLEEIVGEYGFTLETVGITSTSEVPMAMDTLLTKVDCINNLTDNTTVQALSVLLDKANAKGIPVFGSEIEQVKNGCVASESIDYYQLGIKTGEMAAQVLNGADITTIPYETIKDSVIVVNSEALAALNMAVPEGMEAIEAAEAE